MEPNTSSNNSGKGLRWVIFWPSHSRCLTVLCDRQMADSSAPLLAVAVAFCGTPA